MTTATIKWVDPTQRTDGTDIAPDTFTISIYDSLSPTPNTPIGSAPQGTQTCTTGPLSAGVHQFTLVAVDSEGDASQPTAPVAGAVTLAAPLPPTGVTVTVA